MGVYIKDMNMPDECYCCPCSQPVAGGLQGKCNLLWRDFSSNPHSKYPDCPLVEVAAPHGRLIDADELINKHFNSWTCYDTERIGTAPTVLEAESEKNNIEIIDVRNLTQIKDMLAGCFFLADENDVYVVTNENNIANKIVRVLNIETGKLCNIDATNKFKKLNGKFVLEKEGKTEQIKNMISGSLFINEDNEVCMLTNEIVWEHKKEWSDVISKAVILRTGEIFNVSPRIVFKEVKGKLYIKD